MSFARLDWNDRHRNPADTDQFVAFIGNPDLPDLGRLADVQGSGGPGHIAFPDTANVVSIDLKSDGIVLAAVDDEGGAHASQGFGKRDRGSSMQEAIGLPGAMIHGHAAFDEVFPDLRKFHPEMFGHSISAQLLDVGDGQVLLKPDRHWH
jgi:hypothetical protein